MTSDAPHSSTTQVYFSDQVNFYTALVTQNLLLCGYFYTFNRMRKSRAGMLNFVALVGGILASTCITWQLATFISYNIVMLTGDQNYTCKGLQT
jgi:hypothetical protein